MKRFKGPLLIISSTSLGALYPLFGRQLSGEGAVHAWNAFQVCALRGVIGALCCLVVVYPHIRADKRNGRALLAGSGFFLGGTLFYVSIEFIPVALGVMLIYLFPIWLAVYRWYGHRVALIEIAAVVLGFFGVMLVALGGGWGDTSVEPLGILLAGAGSLFAALYVALNKRVNEQGGHPILTPFYGLCLMGVVLSPSLLSANWVVPLHVLGWGIAMGLVSGALYLWILSYALNDMKSELHASILMYAEVGWTILIFAFFDNELPPVMGWVGAGCIVMASVAVTVHQSRSAT